MRAVSANILALLVMLAVGCVRDADGGLSWKWTDKGKPAPPHDVKDAPSPRISPDTHLAAGTMLERQNDLHGAIKQYKKALRADPMMVRAYNRLAVVHQKMNRFSEAEDFYKRGLAANPDSAMLHNNLGYCYLVQKEYEAAEQEFRHALALKPRFERARMNLAIALARTNRLGDSAIEFSRVVPAEEAYYNVAVICVEMRDYEWAAEALRQALAIDPEFGAAKKQLDYVRTFVVSDPQEHRTIEARLDESDDSEESPAAVMVDEPNEPYLYDEIP
ncbi:MAG: tetratricopeptide repeat protein [Phycisphaerae bacterium]